MKSGIHASDNRIKSNHSKILTSIDPSTDPSIDQFSTSAHRTG